MSYWSKLAEKRMSRRRGLTLMGGSAAAAAFMAACGSDDSAPSNGTGMGTGAPTGATGGATGGTGGGSQIAVPVDTSSSARRGGTFRWYANGEPGHFDGGVQGQAQLNLFNGLAYGSLVQNKPGIGEPSTNTEVVPDLAEDWEFSPDGLSVTFHLRQGVRWQDIPPVSGRPFDADDVVANWQRYEALGGNRAANANSINSSAPIVSVTATDSHTVVYELARPTSFILARLATMTTGEAGTQLPREADEGFDPRQEQIGTGGFIRDNYEPSVGLRYRRNPDYWNEQEPYIDMLEMPLVTEYASGLAQLKAGNLWHFNVLPQDVVAAKQEEPRLNLFQTIAAGNNPAAMIGFGWNPLPNGDPSPFLDIRVRRALSLSFDREAFIDAFSNVSRFEDAGLPVETFYYSVMGYIPGWHLDPRDPSFGENSQYYEYNPEEASRLLQAAYPDGMPEIQSHFITQTFFGLDHQQQVEVLDGWAREVGFNVVAEPLDYNLDYLQRFVLEQGNHPGWLYRFGAVSSSDPVDYFVWRFWSRAGATSGNLGFGGPDGSLGDQSGDPEVDRLIEQAMEELDNEARREIVHDLQRYLGGQQYGVMRPGFASGFSLVWPVVGNAQVFQGDSRGSAIGAPGTSYTWWIDESQPPIA